MNTKRHAGYLQDLKKKFEKKIQETYMYQKGKIHFNSVFFPMNMSKEQTQLFLI